MVLCFVGDRELITGAGLVWELSLWRSVEGFCGRQIIPVHPLWEEQKPLKKGFSEEILGVHFTQGKIRGRGMRWFTSDSLQSGICLDLSQQDDVVQPFRFAHEKMGASALRVLSE
jgi:hypothetical protein